MKKWLKSAYVVLCSVSVLALHTEWDHQRKKSGNNEAEFSDPISGGQTTQSPSETGPTWWAGLDGPLWSSVQGCKGRWSAQAFVLGSVACVRSGLLSAALHWPSHATYHTDKREKLCMAKLLPGAANSGGKHSTATRRVRFSCQKHQLWICSTVRAIWRAQTFFAVKCGCTVVGHRFGTFFSLFASLLCTISIF